MTGSWIGILFGVLFILVGGVFLIIALVSRSKAKTAQGWPTVTGTIISSQVQEHADFDADAGSTSTSYLPFVQYTYTVNGVPYTGARIGFGANQFDRKTALRKAEQYPAGCATPVHYDPANPQSAVLEAKAAASKVFLIIGLVFVVFGVIAFCLSGAIAVISMLANS
jgi:hypothetical protein